MACFTTPLVEEEASFDWSHMNGDIMQSVFFKLPETSLFRAASVCKRWNFVTREPSFTARYANQKNAPAPFAFLYNGVKYALTRHDDRAFEFHLLENGSRVPMVTGENSESEDGKIPSVKAAGGLHYALTGLKQTAVHYKLSLLEKQWTKSSKMPYLLQDPIVGLVQSGGPRAHRIVFAGGVAALSQEDDELATSIYDVQTDTWEICEPLPQEFRGSTSALFMSSVVHKGIFYAYDMFSGYVSRLDMESKQWSRGTNLRPSFEMKQLFLVSQSEVLCLVGIKDVKERDVCFNVWNVDEDTMKAGELLHRETVLNARAGRRSAIMRWASSPLDCVPIVIGLLLILVIYLLHLCHSITTRIACRFQGLICSHGYDDLQKKH